MKPAHQKTKKQKTESNDAVLAHYFPQLKQEIEGFEKNRDELIALSNKIIQVSKEIIYATHRKEFSAAEQKVKDADKMLGRMRHAVEQDPKLDIGAYKVAVQEFVEALCYLRFMQEERLPTHKELNAGAEYYLLGICDFVGELSRAAMNAAIANDHALVERIRTFVGILHDELMQINFRNGELRKKVDGVRYETQKLDNLLFQLKLKK